MDIPAGEAPLAYLAYTLPPRPEDVTASDVLDGFLAFVRHQGLDLYPAQEEAILELYEDHNVILATPTGSGKSLVATALHFFSYARKERSIYTAPIKALVNEKFFALCRDFGAANVGMLTGDAVVNAEAPILCCTAEILANWALREGASLHLDRIVMDEFHYYSDRDRGAAWQVPLLTLPRARFLLMSATFGDASFFAEALDDLTGAPTAIVTSKDRPVPLDWDYSEVPLQDEIYSLVQAGKAPVYVVHFTQRACAEGAQNLLSLDYATKEEKRAIAEALRGVRFDSPYGKELQRFLRHSVGIHHAGLLPKYRLLVEKLAQRGLLKIIVGTDTLGVGVNIPIRTVLFSQLCKFDGRKTVLLSARDFHQIAGRAGRRGFDDRGSVVAQAPEHAIENLRLETKAGNDPVKRKRIVRKKPPERGYVHWDRQTFYRLIGSPPEPLVSRFEVSHGMLMQVLQRPRGGCRAMARLLRDCHEPPGRKTRLRETAKQMFAALVDAEVIEPRGFGHVEVHADLQEDFSLNRALSLFLVEVVEALDRDSPTYALDVLSLVEAIVEDPTIILLRQVDKLKTEKLAELKAAGVEYEERMEELEKIEYPKPNAELLYETFNAFARHHPWVSGEAVRPKSIARDMVESFLSFSEYIREYGLERSEGLLLRYLSDVFKTLTQNVPESAKTYETDDIETYLGAIVRSTDNSLLDEWESMQRRAAASGESVATAADRVDVTQNEKGFTVLVRNAVFQVIRALASHDYKRAAELLNSDTPATLERTMKSYFEEFRALRVDAEARGPRCFQIVTREPGEWAVEQLFLAPTEFEAGEVLEGTSESEWFLRVRVDLARSRDEGRPSLELLHLGV